MQTPAGSGCQHQQGQALAPKLECSCSGGGSSVSPQELSGLKGLHL